MMIIVMIGHGNYLTTVMITSATLTMIQAMMTPMPLIRIIHVMLIIVKIIEIITNHN